MIQIKSNPPVSASSTGAFVQTVNLLDGDRVIGRAIWAANDPPQGVIQLLEIWIDPEIRRAGHARRLLRGLIDQAREYHAQRKQPLRRLWAAPGHKSHVVARAFLTSEGFHHVSTTGGLMRDEDQLIYVKSLD